MEGRSMLNDFAYMLSVALVGAITSEIILSLLRRPGVTSAKAELISIIVKGR